MGTNYYLHSPVCSHCGKELEEPLHLGKSSVGWCFGLHIYPELDLPDWDRLWSYICFKTEEDGYVIRNEYGESIGAGSFFSIVWDRKGNPEKLLSPTWLNDNYAIPGPYGLARHAIYPGHCIGHGEGPFDYLIGEFS